MDSAGRNIRIDELDPTFLFTCKGIRVTNEEDYHSHDHVELVYILSGRGSYRIDDVIFPVEEGDLIVLNPGMKHQALVSDPGNPAAEFFVGFTDVKLGDLGPNRIPTPTASPIVHTKGELRQKLFKVCASIEEENSVYWQGRYFMLKAYLMQMLILIVRDQAEPVPVKNGFAFESVNKKYVVEQIVSYFDDHYAEKISLDQIAENMYLSPYYISRIFKSEIGDTPIHYLINIRLKKAKELLESGWSGSVQEAAQRVGYDDVYHFSKLFKKRYGAPPSQVKKK